ncbi:YtxH domain-containing protein [Agromyces sp. H66]|uniref:YtxH domain-containing protein n=1 Tax=Agromyces sp. H66 TaxID=2529859 RepID=UPI0020BE833E|nr:YtxH domain-containing protein [Agromyces sp. H66]
MKGKILFVVGLGVGYVLGARAGRERYEQIRTAAQNVWNQPAVQQGVDTVKDFAKTRVGDLSDTVLDGVKGLIGNATKSSGAAKSAGAKSTTSSSAAKSSTAKSSAAKSSSAKSSAAKSSTAKSSSTKSGSSKSGSSGSSSSSGSGSSAASGS